MSTSLSNYISSTNTNCIKVRLCVSHLCPLYSTVQYVTTGERHVW